MSVLRFFSPARHARSSSPSPSTSRPSSRSGRARSRDDRDLKPRLELHVPSYGSVFMQDTSSGAAMEGEMVEFEPDMFDGQPPRFDMGTASYNPSNSVSLPQEGQAGSGRSSSRGVSTELPRRGESSQHGSRASSATGRRRRRKDRENRGQLTVEIPHNLGRCRIKTIRVGMKTIVELAMGAERGWERDTIFDRQVEVGGGEEGIVLEEGTQRFDFTLLIPADLCGHDRHQNGKIEHMLYAELEGLPASSSKSKLVAGSKGKGRASMTPKGSRLVPRSRSRSRVPSATHSRSASPAPSSPPTPLPSDIPAANGVNPASLSAALHSMSLDQTDDKRRTSTLPPAPPYEVTSGTSTPPVQPPDEIPWLTGTFVKQRYMEVLHNIEPLGGVHELDSLIQGAVDGVGPYEIKLSSDAWTIGSLLFANFNFPEPSADATLYSLRVSLLQTHTIRSPRDDPSKPPTAITKRYMICSHGERPDTNTRYPPPDTPALWRGKDRGGSGSTELHVEIHGRAPSDNEARPSTLPNIPTPIQVQHKLVIEVMFSVWGQDEHGKSLGYAGPGALRAMTIQKPTTLASCAFTPEELRLPTYGTLHHQDAFSCLARKCPLCGLDPPDKVCKTCPPGSIPHARHDLPPKLVGNDEGICPLCAKEVVPTRAPNFDDCACGMDTSYLIERYRSRVRSNERGESTAVGDIRINVACKEEEERGRSRR